MDIGDVGDICDTWACYGYLDITDIRILGVLEYWGYLDVAILGILGDVGILEGDIGILRILTYCDIEDCWGYLGYLIFWDVEETWGY